MFRRWNIWILIIIIIKLWDPQNIMIKIDHKSDEYNWFQQQNHSSMILCPLYTSMASKLTTGWAETSTLQNKNSPKYKETWTKNHILPKPFPLLYICEQYGLWFILNKKILKEFLITIAKVTCLTLGMQRKRQKNSPQILLSATAKMMVPLMEPSKDSCQPSRRFLKNPRPHSSPVSAKKEKKIEAPFG